jgi:hypothetical protein
MCSDDSVIEWHSHQTSACLACKPQIPDACRNRAFRCLFSSKCMEDRPFRAHGRFPCDVKSMSQHEQWLFSLVGVVQQNCKLITVEEGHLQCLGCEAGSSGAALKKGLPLPPAPPTFHTGSVRFTTISVLDRLLAEPRSMNA